MAAMPDRAGPGVVLPGTAAEPAALRRQVGPVFVRPVPSVAVGRPFSRPVSRPFAEPVAAVARAGLAAQLAPGRRAESAAVVTPGADRVVGRTVSVNSAAVTPRAQERAAILPGVRLGGGVTGRGESLMVARGPAVPRLQAMPWQFGVGQFGVGRSGVERSGVGRADVLRVVADRAGRASVGPRYGQFAVPGLRPDAYAVVRGGDDRAADGAADGAAAGFGPGASVGLNGGRAFEAGRTSAGLADAGLTNAGLASAGLGRAGGQRGVAGRADAGLVGIGASTGWSPSATLRGGETGSAEGPSGSGVFPGVFPAGVAAPAASGGAGGGGVVMLDGRLVGRWLADRMGREAARAPSGMTRFDARQSAAWSASGVI